MQAPCGPYSAINDAATASAFEAMNVAFVMLFCSAL